MEAWRRGQRGGAYDERVWAGKGRVDPRVEGEMARKRLGEEEEEGVVLCVWWQPPESKT